MKVRLTDLLMDWIGCMRKKEAQGKFKSLSNLKDKVTINEDVAAPGERQKFGFGHVKSEMPQSHPSGDVSEAAGSLYSAQSQGQE